MKLPAHVANPSLAAVIAGAGFRSLERFAVAVNQRGWEMCGVKLFYDHISVKRWLGGGVCQNPDVDTCDDGDRALALAEHSMSTMVTTRLRELITDTEPYRDMASVAEFRERLRTGLEG